MNALSAKIALPPHAVDTHVHVLDPARFRFAVETAYRPVPSECGTSDDLAATLDASGIERVVLVNPTSGYGEDNRCMFDAIARLGTRARGIARVPLDIAPRALDALVRKGVVGVRLDIIGVGIAQLDDRAFPRLLARLADRDLLLEVQAEADQWVPIAKALATAPVRIVVDHMGRPRPEDGVNAPGFRALLRIVASERAIVKLSGPMRCSRTPAPYDDLRPFVSALVRECTPKRLVWGSDWPFLRCDRRIDYGPLLALLGRWLPSAHDRRVVLAATPARWFGFDAGGGS